MFAKSLQAGAEMNPLRIFTFGRLRVLRGDLPLNDFETRKAEALLVFLACNRRAYPREVLADLLWDERSQQQAQANLRVVLASLRKHLEEYVTIDRETAALNPQAAVWLDISELEKGLGGLPANGALMSTQQADRAAQAIALYQGEFLQGFFVRGSQGLNDWIGRERERLHHLAIDGLHDLVDYELHSGDYKAGMAHAARLIELDPLMEDAHCQLMQLLAFSGQRKDALVQYETLKRILWDELGIQPSETTEHLVRSIRSGELERAQPSKRAIRDYQLREQIGAGNFGAVYRAYQPTVEREVAIKVILPQFANDPDFIRRFESEAQIVARLEHPHIVPLYDFWRVPDGAYLVMRFLRGGSLESLLEKGPLEMAQAARLVEQVASGLAAAHQKGVIHRDLKPANILLDEAGNAYLSDFGIAKQLFGLDQAAQTGPVAGSPAYMSPEQLRSEPVTPQSDIYTLGLLLYEILTGSPPFKGDSLAALIEQHLHTPTPSIQEGNPNIPLQVDQVIQRATAKDPSQRYPDALALAAQLLQAVRGDQIPAGERAIPPLALSFPLANPYKGLRAFEEGDAADFSGREALVDRLLTRLAVGDPAGRFLAVVGPSGSGKSSLVKAGLIPALRRGVLPGSERWFVLEMLPGSHPFEELEIGLLRLATSPALNLIEQLRRDERGILRAVRLALPDPDCELLLVIDQFEELFTLVVDKAEADRFLDGLFIAASEPHSPLRLVVTLRADFFDRPLLHPDFAALVQDGTEAIVPMTAEELERAIRSPAVRVGATFEDGLVTAIVGDVLDQPGALPLLQYALTELYERRSDSMLTRAAYQAIGGVPGALARRAEEVFQSLDEPAQAAARQVFLRLVTLGEGVEDTRRRALQAELEALEGLPLSPIPSPLQGIGDQGKKAIDSVLAAFGQARLLSFDRDPLSRTPTVEVAHEALLREWRRLGEWLDASRADLRMQRVLANAAADWAQAKQEASFLLRGARLDQFEAWQASTGLALTQGERTFLEASLADRQKRRAAEAARQEHERALERRSRNFLRGLVAVFAGAAVVAVLLSLFAFNQQRLARQNEIVAGENAATAVAARGEAEQLAKLRSREAQVNQSLALAAHSRLALQADNLDLALALAMEAVRIPDPPGRSQMALSEAAYAPGTIRQFIGHQAAVWSVAVSPDGRYGLSGDEAGVIFLWDLETGQALRRLEGHSDMVNGLAFTPDGRQAVSASQDKTLIHWDLETGQVIQQIAGHQSGVNTVAVSPDGRQAASGSGGNFILDNQEFADDNSVRLWNLQSGEQIRRFNNFSDGVTGVSFTPDGRRLAIVTKVDGFIVLDIETGKVILRPGGIDGDITSVVVSPDGQMALTAGASTFEVAAWDMPTGEAVQHLTGHNSTLYGLAISPDGQRAMGGSNTVIEWDLESGEPIQQFNYGANAIAYRPDGTTALIGSNDQTLRLLALGSDAEIGRLPASQNWVTGMAYSPDGQTVLVNDSGLLYRWDLKINRKIWSQISNSSSFWEIAISPDGKQALTTDIEFASVWDVMIGEVLTRLEGHGTNASVDAVAFHPGGRFAISGSQGNDTNLIYWDLESGKPVWRFDPVGQNVLGVAISSDGRTALSAEADGIVNWWDLETGQLIRKLEGHTNNAWSVAFVDDHTAISASDDSTMILWDLQSGTALHSFLGHSSGIKRVVLSPDKRLALSASRDGTLILWDVQSGTPLRRYAGHTDQLMTVAWHPGGGEALSGGRDNQAIRWRIDADLETFLDWVDKNRYVRPLTCDERSAFQVEPLCKSGSEIAAAETNSTPAPTEVTGAALLPPLPTPTPLASAPPPAPAAAMDAGTAAWGANPGSFPAGGGQVWEYVGNAGERLSIRVAADRPVNTIWGIDRQRESGLLDPAITLYAPDGSLLAGADDLENGVATDAYIDSITLPQSGIYRIEVRSYQDQTSGGYRLILADPRPVVLRTNLPSTAGLAILPDGRTALVGVGRSGYPVEHARADNRIWVWDLSTGEVLHQLEGHQDTPVAIAISSDGERALSVGLDGQAILWNLGTWREISRFGNPGQAFMGVLFHPDGQRALTASSDGSLALWDLASGDVLQRFKGHEGWVMDLALSPDGKTVFSTSTDKTLRAWEVASGELIANYQPFASSFANGLAISPDGQWLLGGEDQLGGSYLNDSIALLDVATGEKLLDLEGHTAVVESVAFSPDGRYALSGSRDNTVRLWEVNIGEQLAVFTGHTDWVWKVAFSPDGLTGYSTALDGSLRVWDLRDFISASEGASSEN